MRSKPSWQPLTADFVDSAFEDGDTPPFLDMGIAAPETVYDFPVQTTLAPAAGERRPIFQPPDETTTAAGGVAEGPLEISLCLPDQSCGDGMLQPGRPGQLRLAWSDGGAIYRLPVPEDAGGFSALRLRAAVDPTHPLNSAAAPLAFRVRLTDTSNNQATVDIPRAATLPARRHLSRRRLSLLARPAPGHSPAARGLRRGRSGNPGGR
jgi:hypothetical protein